MCPEFGYGCVKMYGGIASAQLTLGLYALLCNHKCLQRSFRPGALTLLHTHCDL